VDINGNEYFGKSQGLQITKGMFDWVKSGKSLNEIIEEIFDITDNKKKNRISGYLTSGYYIGVIDSTAVVSAIQFMKNSNKSYEKIEEKLNG